MVEETVVERERERERGSQILERDNRNCEL